MIKSYALENSESRTKVVRNEQRKLAVIMFRVLFKGAKLLECLQDRRCIVDGWRKRVRMWTLYSPKPSGCEALPV